MAYSKIVGIMVLIAFAFGILLVENAVAGEKFNWRAVWYRVKSESVNASGEEGRAIRIYEDRGILTVLQGNKQMDGLAGVNVGFSDSNSKTGAGLAQGEVHFIDRNGDKIYWTWEFKGAKGIWSGTASLFRGTGKFEGMKGKATLSSVLLTPNQFYVNWEGEME